MKTDNFRALEAVKQINAQFKALVDLQGHLQTAVNLEKTLPEMEWRKAELERAIADKEANLRDLKAQSAGHNEARRAALQELESERQAALKQAREELNAERTKAQNELAQLSVAIEQARREHADLVRANAAEIKAQTDELARVKAEIAALKAKFAA